MCNLEAARKACKLQELDTNLSNIEQLFNRQFLSLSDSQTDDLCKQRREWARHWEAEQKQKSGPLWQDLPRTS